LRPTTVVEYSVNFPKESLEAGGRLQAAGEAAPLPAETASRRAAAG
jgi:hypothetical protein